MKGCVLIKVEPGKHNQVAARVSELKGVKIAFPTLGRQDVVAGVEVADIREMASLVSQIQTIDHVRGTETLIAVEV